jgi:hypothetical protein
VAALCNQLALVMLEAVAVAANGGNNTLPLQHIFTLFLLAVLAERLALAAILAKLAVAAKLL